jgi:hypothetical protein
MVSIKTKKEFEDYKKNVSAFLNHDLLAPDKEFGPRSFKFPFLFSMIKVFFSNNFLEKLNFNQVRETMDYEKFYNMDYSIELTGRICKEFVKTARARNAKPIITFIPDIGEFIFYSKHAYWLHEPLIKWLKDNKIHVFDFSPHIFSKLNADFTIQDIYDTTRHFNAQGDSLLAEIFVNHFSIVQPSLMVSVN